jgi:exodeoxyribonuclease-3
MTRFVSWNVNGIRACTRHGFVRSILSLKADVIGLQEVRASREQILEEVLQLEEYPHQYYFGAEKKGYSGVSIFSKEMPEDVIEGLGVKEFDVEGRVISARFKNLFYISAYFPNSQDKGKRIQYKLDFCQAMEEWASSLEKKFPLHSIVLAGDFNIAHEEIDLARPDDNHQSAGFLPQEREWMSSFLNKSWVDSFRALHPKAVKYSWWSARTRARERNIGWRIDYHALKNLKKHSLYKAEIHDDILGSDHCPVSLVLKDS